MNSSMDWDSGCEFYGCSFRVFSDMYAPLHLPLSLGVCVVGFVCNALNVFVLTRPHMRTSANTLLTGLSLAQLMLVGNYAGLALLRMGRLRCWAGGWSWAGTAYMKANATFSLFLHSVAFSHTLAIALFRVIAVTRPLHAQFFLKVRTATLSSAFIFVGVALLCVPTVFASHVDDFTTVIWQNCSTAEELVPQFDLEWSHNVALLSFILWFFGVVFKLVPCLLITVLSAILIFSLGKVGRRRKVLLRGVTSRSDAASSAMLVMLGAGLGRRRSKDAVRTRTTRLLLLLVLLCVAVELPHGVVNLLGAVYGWRFSVAVYDNLGDAFELLTLAYSSANFVICCAMSRDFRATFVQTYSLKPTPQRAARLLQSRTTHHFTTHRPLLKRDTAASL